LGKGGVPFRLISAPVFGSTRGGYNLPAVKAHDVANLFQRIQDEKTMKLQNLGTSDLQVTRIAYGCMPLGGSWDRAPLGGETRKEAVKSVRAALEAGINFFDHADIYCMGKSEEVFSVIWQEVPGLRERILLQSKCGIRFPGEPRPHSPQRFDFSYEHIVQSVEGSLRRLKTDYLDVLLLHRPDPLVEPEEVARAFDALHEAGKVRYFGVSNHTAAQLKLLRRALRQPIVANQVAFNPIHTHMLDEGIVFNQDNPLLARNEGTIEYCRMHNITLQAWGALAWGQLTGRQDEAPGEKVVKTSALVAEMAREKGVAPEAILIAWILRHPARIQAIIGTTRPERIAAASQADSIELDREEWYRLFTAGRGESLP
jgi:predicted oxidoreductase